MSTRNKPGASTEAVASARLASDNAKDLAAVAEEIDDARATLADAIGRYNDLLEQSAETP